MDLQDVKKLEELLEKLKSHIGQNICVAPACWHEGYYISTYNRHGDAEKQVFAKDINDCLTKLEKPILDVAIN